MHYEPILIEIVSYRKTRRNGNGAATRRTRLDQQTDSDAYPDPPLGLSYSPTPVLSRSAQCPRPVLCPLPCSLPIPSRGRSDSPPASDNLHRRARRSRRSLGRRRWCRQCSTPAGRLSLKWSISRCYARGACPGRERRAAAEAAVGQRILPAAESQ